MADAQRARPTIRVQAAVGGWAHPWPNAPPRGWRGFTMTATGLRLLQDLRRALLEPPTQIRPDTP